MLHTERACKSAWLLKLPPSQKSKYAGTCVFFNNPLFEHIICLFRYVYM